MDDRIREMLRQLPAMDELLSLPWVPRYEGIFGRYAVKRAFAEAVGEERDGIRKKTRKSVNSDDMANRVKKALEHRATRSMRGVINATGVVVHTNLGRSCLPESAVRAVSEVAAGYSTLEYNLHEGTRGHRNEHVEWLICQATGADAALVVNNNAAAVILALAGLAVGREVIISRGELVEIGGSFRIPDIMAFSGAKMVEVGTTNRTRIGDFEGAVTENTGVLLKVHPSNYRIEGFHEAASREELAALAREKDLLFMEDMGSGLLSELEGSLCSEPSVRQCLESGLDLVTFSGDKLLGGPQIGVLAGARQVVDRLRKHPLLRAFRVDKMTLAAFEEVLRLYLAGREAEIPTYRMLHTSQEELLRCAQSLSEECSHVMEAASVQGGYAAVVPVDDAVGGGAYPATPLPGYAVAIKVPRLGSAGRMQDMFRRCSPPIVVGAQNDAVHVHVRTLLPGDAARFAEAFGKLLGGAFR